MKGEGDRGGVKGEGDRGNEKSSVTGGVKGEVTGEE